LKYIDIESVTANIDKNA